MFGYFRTARMSTLLEVPEGHVLRLRATFTPTTLSGVLGAKAWSHWIERGKRDDWVICFYRAEDFSSGRLHPHSILES